MRNYGVFPELKSDCSQIISKKVYCLEYEAQKRISFNTEKNMHGEFFQLHAKIQITYNVWKTISALKVKIIT